MKTLTSKERRRIKRIGLKKSEPILTPFEDILITIAFKKEN